MTGFNHGLTGAVIALTVKQPALAIPLAFASHYVTDMIPHFGFKQDEVFNRQFNNFLKFDFAFSIFLMIVLALLFPTQRLLIWSCMTVSAGPDIIWWFYRKAIKDWPNGLDKFTAWHLKINNKSHTNHLYYDAAWFVLMWAIILIKL